LELPFVVRPVPHAPGKRIEGTEIEIPPVLIWLATVEQRSLYHPWSVIDGCRDDAERDVRRVERVVAEWCDGMVSRRCAMHVRHRTQRGLADRPPGQREPR